MFGRGPTDSELNRTVAFLERQAATYAAKRLEDAKPANANASADANTNTTANANANANAAVTAADKRLALASFCQALLSASEFLYVD